MHRSEIVKRVGELRGQGKTPKQIAAELDIDRAQVIAILKSEIGVKA